MSITIFKSDARKERETITYRHNLPPFPQHPLPRIHIHNRAIQSPTRLLNHPRSKKHTRLPGHLLQDLPRPIATTIRAPRHGQSALNPVIPRAGGGIAQVDGGLEVLQELVAAVRRAGTDRRAEVAGAWIPA